MVNGYADLGSWYGFTPYVGAGVGFARNTLSGLTDTAFNTLAGGSMSSSAGYAGDHSKWNFAWALMAGLSFDVTQNLKLDLGYRYLDVGKFASGSMACLNGGGGLHPSKPELRAVDPIEARRRLQRLPHRLALDDRRSELRAAADAAGAQVLIARL